MWIASTFRIKWINKVNKLETRTRPNWYLRLSDNTLCVFWIRFFFYFFEFWTTISGCLTLNNPHRSTTRSLSKNRLAHTNAAKTRFSLLFISIVASSFTFSVFMSPDAVNSEHWTQANIVRGNPRAIVNTRKLDFCCHKFNFNRWMCGGQVMSSRRRRRSRRCDSSTIYVKSTSSGAAAAAAALPSRVTSETKNSIPCLWCAILRQWARASDAMSTQRRFTSQLLIWWSLRFFLLRCVRRTANRESPAEWPQNENGIKIY